MKKVASFLFALLAFASSAFAAKVDVQSAPIALVGAQGYDLVSYHTSMGPERGSGYNAFAYMGVTYIFKNKENLDTFKSNPEKYLPAFGGFCAMGVAKGKKIEVDPKVWEVVDGRLYLNVNGDVQKIWQSNQMKNIDKASMNWGKIHAKSPAML